jgi:hypothetical protein
VHGETLGCLDLMAGTPCMVRRVGIESSVRVKLATDVDSTVIHEFPHYLLELVYLLSETIHSLTIGIFLNFEGLIFLL